MRSGKAAQSAGGWHLKHFPANFVWVCALWLLTGCAGKLAPAFEPAPAAAPPAPSLMAQPGSAQGSPSIRTPLGAEDRVLIYRAELSLTVLDVEEALAQAQRAVETLGGYLQGIDNASIQLRVPAKRFQEAIDQLSRLGTVTSRSIAAQDVTEEMVDLEIRLDTARQMRQRLLAILKRSESVEDALAVEKELGRVVTEIERIEGKLRLLREQVDFSSVRLHLNPTVAAEAKRRLVPFPWVQQLARRLDQQRVAHGRVRGRPPFDLPPGFVRYQQDRRSMSALSADGVILSHRVHDNPDSAPLAYWNQVAVAYLTEVRHVVIETTEQGISANGEPAAILHGVRGSGGAATGYSLALVVTDRNIHVLEAFGEADAMLDHREVPSSWLKNYRAR